MRPGGSQPPPGTGSSAKSTKAALVCLIAVVSDSPPVGCRSNVGSRKRSTGALSGVSGLSPILMASTQARAFSVVSSARSAA